MVATLTNDVTNPQPKLVETGWSRSDGDGTSTFTRVTTGFDASTDAYMVMEFTAVSAAVEGWVRYTHPVVAGDLLSAAIEIISSRAQVLTPTVTFVDASANILEVYYGADLAAAAATRVRVGVSNMTAPTGAVEAWITAAVSLETGVAPVVGDTFQVSRAIVSESLAVPAYGDGSYANWVWDGAEWASASTGVADTAPALVAFSDFDPVPRVQFTFASLHPLAATITVERVVGTRAFRVRSAINVFAIGGYGNLDFEAPKGVLSTYRAEQFDTAGVSLGYTSSAAVTLDFAGACIHQPLDPAKNVAYQFTETAAADLLRPTRGDLVHPEGRPEPVWVGGPRRALENINLDGITETLVEAEALESMFGTYDEPQMPIVCVRTDGMDLPPTLFVVIEEPHRVGLNRRFGGEAIEWKMVGNQVSPPAEGLIVPLLTYDDLDAAYATYDARDAAYATYLAMDTDYTLVGASDA